MFNTSDLEPVIEIFLENDLTSTEEVLSLSNEELKDELGIKSLGLRKKIMAKIDGLRENTQSNKGLLDSTFGGSKSQTNQGSNNK